MVQAVWLVLRVRTEMMESLSMVKRVTTVELALLRMAQLVVPSWPRVKVLSLLAAQPAP